MYDVHSKKAIKFSRTEKKKKKSFTRIGVSVWNLLYVPPVVILVYFQETKSLYYTWI